jgi:hypothetical protein
MPELILTTVIVLAIMCQQALRRSQRLSRSMR